MANWLFTSSRYAMGVVQLDFVPESGKYPMTVTLPLHSAHQLAAGLLNALRVAHEEHQQVPALQFGTQSIEVALLPVDQWRVTTSPALPGLALLHLLAVGGLSLTYSFGTDATRFVGEALAATAREPSTPGRS